MKSARWIPICGATLALVAAGATGSLIQRAAGRAPAKANPLAHSEGSRLAGAKLYARECASCHGPDREGTGKAPPLAQPEVYDAAPGTLFWILRNGSLRRGMPSFAHLPEASRWQIVTFLNNRESGTHSLRKQVPGPMRVERQAGRPAAATASSATRSTTDSKVAASKGLTW